MKNRPKIEEQYKKGNDIINYVVYNSTTGAGEDEVLQHKIMGTTETAHITLHPDNTINFRIKRSKNALETAVRNNLSGYSPELSVRVKQFISKVRPKI
jgi:hypothetical protein